MPFKEMFYGHTSYLDTPTLNGFGVVKERFSNLRNLYQLSSILVIGSWACFATDTLNKTDGIMKKEDYLQNL